MLPTTPTYMYSLKQETKDDVTRGVTGFKYKH